MHDQLADAAMREVLTLGVPADADDGDFDDDDAAEPHKLSLTRDRVARVLAMLEAKRANGGLTADETKALEAATLRLYGGGTSPKKFARLDAQQVDGVLRGQYRFAGAGQTGRLSSRGAQIYNLTRDVLGHDGAEEAALVDAIAEGCTYSELVAAPPADVPAARKLALLAPRPRRGAAENIRAPTGWRSRRASRHGSPRPPAPIRFSTSSAPTIAIPLCRTGTRSPPPTSCTRRRGRSRRRNARSARWWFRARVRRLDRRPATHGAELPD